MFYGKKEEFMNNKRVKTKAMAMAVAAAMAVDLCPVTAFAVTGSQVAADGTYTSSAHVSRDEVADVDDNWTEYGVSVSLTVKDGKFEDITVTPDAAYDTKNDDYFNKAYNKSKGIQTLLKGKPATEETINGWKIAGVDGATSTDAVSGATRTATAVKQAALAAIQSAAEAPTPVTIDTAALEESIKKASEKQEADYTAASWNVLKEKLEAAQKALSEKASQTAVDEAQKALDQAIADLVSKPAIPVKFNEDKTAPGLTKNDGAEDADVTTYLQKISSVTVNGTKYAATDILDAEGNLKTDAEAFAEGKEFTIVVSAEGYDDVTFTYQKEENDGYHYVYAGLTWAEYWKNEAVQNAGSTASSDVQDNRGEYDKGAFDTVTRATTNHGLHRGSYQCMSTIYMKDGKTYNVAYYTGITTAVLTDGTTVTYNKSDIDHYVVTGLKYVPVKVKNEDYEAFCQKYAVVENGETMNGGYTEKSLNAYTATADVTKDTNGLKEATKNEDGSFSFSARKSDGTDSGLKGVELKTATGVEPTVKTAGGEFGEFLRVDINGNYGDLGANMQSVIWTYYGDDSTYSKPLATFGTKFAADNWMHSSMGIQLGLTESERCKLPEGSDGTGYWKLTLCALGYEDFEYTFQATKENSVLADPVTNRSQLDEAIKNAEALDEDYYTEKSWATLASALSNAKSGKYTQTQVENATENLNKAIGALVKAEYKYVYAGLTWSEYWANEAVQNARSTDSSDVQDNRGEYDKGAFDTVTRATTNHGLHRGSYQCTAYIEAENGKTYNISYWTDKNVAVLTDGSSITFNKGTITEADGTTTKMTKYDVTGLKYVPVKVKVDDLKDFYKEYTVVKNGGTLEGGCTEKSLQGYTATAAVTENTNGLKEATKNADGSFSFSARKSDGTDSGLKGVTLKKATDVEPEVKTAGGEFGEFLRVDINGNYGDLGANMQSVIWTYYGDDSTYTTPVATFGTKFAADNWMHSSMGIQLGLTESERCKLPEGSNGTGYWRLTLCALGYEDYTYDFQATKDNSVLADPVTDRSKLDDAIASANELKESDYTTDSWKTFSSALKTATGGLYTQKQVEKALENLNTAMDGLVESATYVLMNIPYDQFYKADVKNDVKVDAFTSATKNKVRTGSLAGGSYHVDASGDEITGVTFPVKVPAGTDLSKYTQITDDSKVSITVTNRGQESTTDYTGKDALFESASYSYYTLSEKPSYYKELTVNEDGSFSFGATQGTATTITEGVTAELMTESSYGDYQLDLDGLTDTIPSGTAIYGVIVSTKEGSDYGMRHLENIWRVSELAWATGFTSAVHNCPTSSEHYKAMMGQHINKVTYYTANGIYEIPVGGEEGLYVPVKFDTSAVAVADAELKDGETSVATTISGLTLPEGFDAEYTVDGATAIVKGEKLILKDVKKGAYTLTITDKSGKYAPISVGFEVYAETIPASYNENAEKPGLTKAAGATDAEFADYIKNITSVSVNGKSYAASGRGAVKLFNDDGTLITDAAPFAEGDSFEIVVTATGYKDLSFTYKKAAKEDPVQEINTASLEKAIQSAEALKEADYTADSWKVLQVALKNAKSALEAKKDQTSVDNAAASLNKAIEALVKADGSTPTPTPTTTPTTTPAASKNNTTTSGTGNKTTTSSGSTSSSKTAKTGDPTNILEMLGLAVASLGTGGFALKRRKRNKK